MYPPMVSDELFFDTDALIPYDDFVTEYDEVTTSVFLSIAFHMLQFFGEWMN